MKPQNHSAARPSRKFELGVLVITLNALRTINQFDVLAAVKRHKSGDWGELANEDAAANEAALQSGGRILSAYTTSTGAHLWVITEADRSATTVLLPEDY